MSLTASAFDLDPDRGRTRHGPRLAKPDPNPIQAGEVKEVGSQMLREAFDQAEGVARTEIP